MSGTDVPFVNDPDFQEALASFQNEEWDNGLSKLDSLIEQYPEITQLREFRQDMLLRSHVDEYERVEKQREFLKQIALWGGRVVVIAAIVFMVAWGLNSYSSWLEKQWHTVRQVVVQEVQTLDTAVKYRNAQNFLGAGRPEDALPLLNEIEEQDPDFPGLTELRVDASQKVKIEKQYQAASDLMGSGDTVAALSAYKIIQDQQPGYKDVPILIQEIESNQILDELYSQAVGAYADEDWDDSILGFESLRTEAPKFKSEQVEERLIDSYINAAILALDDNSPTSDALISADRYFREALVLRPMNQEILAAQDKAMDTFKERLFLSYLEKARETLFDNEDSLDALSVANSYYDLALGLKPGDTDVILERQLTSAYLKAQQSFLNSDWTNVIDNLEIVIQHDKDYANGTSRQTLYEAYMKRGRKFITNGEYEAAIEDFQRASEIADETPEAKIQVYWSLIEMADVYGILGDYQKADSLYNHAVEWIGLREILQPDHKNLVVLLDEADRYAGIEWFRTSYRLYNRVLPAEDLIYSAIYHEVSDGDYLTKIARSYQTTVEAILDANEISEPGDIRTGQRILVPILSGDEE
ncbi:LysM peptidoglycan-binding domain-containing protein [Chloroflexota bacterium]